MEIGGLLESKFKATENWRLYTLFWDKSVQFVELLNMRCRNMWLWRMLLFHFFCTPARYLTQNNRSTLGDNLPSININSFNFFTCRCSGGVPVTKTTSLTVFTNDRKKKIKHVHVSFICSCYGEITVWLKNSHTNHINNLSFKFKQQKRYLLKGKNINLYMVMHTFILRTT